MMEQLSIATVSHCSALSRLSNSRASKAPARYSLVQFETDSGTSEKCPVVRNNILLSWCAVIREDLNIVCVTGLSYQVIVNIVLLSDRHRVRI